MANLIVYHCHIIKKKQWKISYLNIPGSEVSFISKQINIMQKSQIQTHKHECTHIKVYYIAVRTTISNPTFPIAKHFPILWLPFGLTNYRSLMYI